MEQLNKTKLGKSIRYYLSEIFIVIIGIFIAFQLNNWNESIKNKKNEINSLKRILTDLNDEKKLLTDFKNYIKQSKTYLIDVIYNEERENLETIYYNFSPFIHYRMDSEYVSLKSSGKLFLVKNDTLRYKIVQFYERQYGLYAEISENHKIFANGVVSDYFQNEFSRDTTYLLQPREVKEKINNKKFRDIVNEQILYINDINNKLRIENIKDITRMIENEIK